MIIKHKDIRLPFYTDVANTFSRQLKGLMFERYILWALIFPLNKTQKIGIHSLFMHQAIDVVMVHDNKIVEMTTLKPWKFYTSKVNVDWFVEFPAGSIKLHKLKVGDDMKW